MPTWEEVQKMMREAKTPQEKAEAARALSEYVPPSMQGASLVTMHKGEKNVVNLGNLQKEAQDPKVFKRLKDITSGNQPN